MKNRLSQITVLFVLLCLAAGTCAAAGSKGFKPSKPKAPETHVTVISAVTPTSLTILEDKVTKSFAITQFTEINMNGQRATLADLKPGMSVSVTLGSDASKLSRIDAGPSPVAPSAPKG